MKFTIFTCMIITATTFKSTFTITKRFNIKNQCVFHTNRRNNNWNRFGLVNYWDPILLHLFISWSYLPVCLSHFFKVMSAVNSTAVPSGIFLHFFLLLLFFLLQFELYLMLTISVVELSSTSILVVMALYCSWNIILVKTHL